MKLCFFHNWVRYVLGHVQCEKCKKVKFDFVKDMQLLGADLLKLDPNTQITKNLYKERDKIDEIYKTQKRIFQKF